MKDVKGGTTKIDPVFKKIQEYRFKWYKMMDRFRREEQCVERRRKKLI